MLNITRALNNDRLIRALTGLNRKAFDELCVLFAPVYEASLQVELKPRKRARGGGRKARLESTQAKVFFILFYFKCYPTFDVLSIIFDLERGRSNRWVHRLQGILETTLGRRMVLPERKITSIERFLERFLKLRRSSSTAQSVLSNVLKIMRNRKHITQVKRSVIPVSTSPNDARQASHHPDPGKTWQGPRYPST